MSEPKWTHGPWQFWAGNVFGSGLNTRRMIADVAQVSEHTPDCEDCANAHLIAAAPELYEALVNLTAEVAGEYTEDDPEILAALHAIAKARGEHER